MTRSEVIRILGKPDGFRSANGYEWFQYSHRLATGWAWDRADYNDFFQEFCAFELEQIIERTKRGLLRAGLRIVCSSAA